jgi:hypothetical protein
MYAHVFAAIQSLSHSRVANRRQTLNASTLKMLHCPFVVIPPTEISPSLNINRAQGPSIAAALPRFDSPLRWYVDYFAQ